MRSRAVAVSDVDRADVPNNALLIGGGFDRLADIANNEWKDIQRIGPKIEEYVEG